MTTGIIMAVLLVLLVCNVFVKKTGSKTIRQNLGKAHRFLGILFLLAALVHLALTLPLIRQRPISMYILGGIMIAGGVVAALSFCFRRRLKARWIVIHRIAAGVMAVCLILHVAVGISSLKSYQSAIAEIEIVPVDLTQVEDGTYMGECDAGYVYARVQVSVANGALTEVKLLEHRTERGTPAEVIPQQMVAEQQVNVDAVSGATAYHWEAEIIISWERESYNKDYGKEVL